MFLASALNQLPNVRGLHEGHDMTGDEPKPVLPLLNVQNRQAWESDEDATLVAKTKRGAHLLEEAADGNDVLVDCAFYNTAIFPGLVEMHGEAKFVGVVRRCESFVRSATILEGEDLQPAGWAGPEKALTGRESFISLGRHKPQKQTLAGERWDSWSGIQRNIWLWSQVNERLASFARSLDNMTLLFFEDLRENPQRFWTLMLEAIGIADDENLAACMKASENKINSRSNYQVGERTEWSAEERELYDLLAAPLEESIYATH